jgi:hypothetical protein
MPNVYISKRLILKYGSEIHRIHIAKIVQSNSRNICVTKPVHCPAFVSQSQYNVQHLCHKASALSNICGTKPVQCPLALRELYSFKILFPSFPFLFRLHPTCHPTWHFEWDLNVYINGWVNRYYYIQVWYEPFAEYSEAFSTVVHVIVYLVPDVPETVSAFIIKGWCVEHCVCWDRQHIYRYGHTTHHINPWSCRQI